MVWHTKQIFDINCYLSVKRRKPVYADVYECEYFKDFCKIEVPPARMDGQYGIPVYTYTAEVASFLKYFRRPPPNVCTRTMDVAWSITLSKWCDNLREAVAGEPLRVLSVEEAILTMNLKASPGWPWHLRFPTKGQYVLDPSFMPFHNEFYESLGSGTPLQPFQTLIVKQEMRVAAKCKEGAVRVVFGCCVHLVVALLRLVGSLNIVLRNLSHQCVIGKSWCAVGMSPFQGNFNAIANRTEGLHAWELDGSSWDASIWWDMFYRLWQFKCKLMQGVLSVEQELKLLDLYYMMVYSPVVMSDGSVLYKSFGNSSGQGATTVDNTIINQVWTTYGLLRSRSVPMISRFFTDFNALNLGDDNNLMSVHKIDIARFGATMIADCGVEYTFSSEESQPLTNLKWMNFGFELRNGRWYPKLDMVKTLFSLLIGGGCTASLNETLERALCIRMMAYGHMDLFVYVDKYCRWLITFPGVKTCLGSFLSIVELEDLYQGKSLKTLTRVVLECDNPYHIRLGDIEFHSKDVGQAGNVGQLKYPSTTSVNRNAGKFFHKFVERPFLSLIGSDPDEFEYHPSGARRIEKLQVPTRKPGVLQRFERMPPQKSSKARAQLKAVRRIARSRPGPVLGSIGRRPILIKRKARKGKKNGNGPAPRFPVASGITRGLGGKLGMNGRDSTQSMRITGHDYIGPVEVKSDAKRGDILATIDVSPRFLGAPRLEKLSFLFEKYWCNRLTVHFETSTPTSTPGQLLGFFEMDVDDTIATGDAGIRAGTSHQLASPVRVIEDFNWNMPGQKKIDLFMDQNGSDDRLIKQAKFVLLLQTPPGVDLDIGSLYVTYDFTLKKATITDDLCPDEKFYASSWNNTSAGGPGNVTLVPDVIGGTTNIPGLALSYERKTEKEGPNLFDSQSFSFTNPSIANFGGGDKLFGYMVCAATVYSYTNTPAPSYSGWFRTSGDTQLSPDVTYYTSTGTYAYGTTSIFNWHTAISGGFYFYISVEYSGSLPVVPSYGCHLSFTFTTPPVLLSKTVKYSGLHKEFEERLAAMEKKYVGWESTSTDVKPKKIICGGEPLILGKSWEEQQEVEDSAFDGVVNLCGHGGPVSSRHGFCKMEKEGKDEVKPQASDRPKVPSKK